MLKIKGICIRYHCCRKRSSDSPHSTKKEDADIGFEKDKVFQRTAIKIKNSDSNIK